MSKEIWGSCYTCTDYRSTKDLVALSNALSVKAEKEGRDVIDVADEFMMTAHERHLSGQPLRTGGPVRVTDPMLGRLAALFSPGLFEGEIEGTDQ